MLYLSLSSYNIGHAPAPTSAPAPAPSFTKNSQKYYGTLTTPAPAPAPASAPPFFFPPQKCKLITACALHQIDHNKHQFINITNIYIVVTMTKICYQNILFCLSFSWFYQD